MGGRPDRTTLAPRGCQLAASSSASTLAHARPEDGVARAVPGVGDADDLTALVDRGRIALRAAERPEVDRLPTLPDERVHHGAAARHARADDLADAVQGRRAAEGAPEARDADDPTAAPEDRLSPSAEMLSPTTVPASTATAWLSR
jgi:hypothetical protein